jgi:D-ribose pyranose/furanose isomerase RbsD
MISPGKVSGAMRRAAILILAFAALCARTSHSQDWKAKLSDDVTRFGHRNWIVVADSAYPLQASSGIETMVVDADQLAVVGQVINDLKTAKHVRAIVYTDSELSFVPEQDAKGVNAYRASLTKLLSSQGDHQTLPHEQILQKLDEAGKTFKILIIKTPLTIPYTSVFFQLDCGYWSSEAEQRLRAAMASSVK